jgi:hypothetical protein
MDRQEQNKKIEEARKKGEDIQKRLNKWCDKNLTNDMFDGIEKIINIPKPKSRKNNKN